MRVQLLLLLALVGPFCAFTQARNEAEDVARQRASPKGPTALTTPAGTEAATHTPSEAAATSEAPPDLTTLPRPTEPATTPTEATSEAAAEVTPVSVTAANAPDVSTAPPEPPTAEPVSPTAETDVATEPARTVQPVATEAAEAGVGEEAVVEGDVAEGLGSGQVAGIAIGALLAVVVVVAVVIVVVRRMGKYSP